MSDSVIGALIGLAGSITASVIGALVTLHIHNSQQTQPGPSQTGGMPERQVVAAPSTPRRRANLAIPFTAISLVLAVLFGVFLAQALRGPSPTPTPTAIPAVAQSSPTSGPLTTPQGITTAAAVATSTSAPGVYGPGARAQLTQGVYLTISQMQVANGSLNWRGTVLTLTTLGAVLHDLGNDVEATELLEESLALSKELGETWGTASALRILGSIARGRGETEQARQLYTESLSLFQGNGDQRGIALVQAELATL